MVGLHRNARRANGEEGEEFTFDTARVISAGSFGTVCHGKLIHTSMEIVVKISNDPQDRASLRAEYEILRTLDGAEGVIQAFGLQDKGSIVCIALEKADGSVYHLLKRAENIYGLHYTAMLDLMRDIKTALEVLKEFHIAHRDIKPENILFFTKETGIISKYQFKLCDFGVARFVENMEKTYHTIAGTVAFLHPAVVEALVRGDGRTITESRKMNAEKCDLWSIGVTLYLAATGSLPFDSTNPKVLHHILSHRSPGVISHTHKGKNLFVLENYTYPDWIRVALSHLIGRLFDWPKYSDMLEMFEELMAEEEKTIFVVRNARIVTHRDLSDSVHFQGAAVPLTEVLGMKQDHPYYFFSNKGHIHFHLDHSAIDSSLHACEDNCGICYPDGSLAPLSTALLRDPFYMLGALPTNKARFMVVVNDSCPASDKLHNLYVCYLELLRAYRLQQVTARITETLRYHRISFPSRIEKRVARVTTSAGMDYETKMELLEGLRRLMEHAKMVDIDVAAPWDVQRVYELYTRCDNKTAQSEVNALYNYAQKFNADAKKQYNNKIPDILRQCRRIADISQCLEQSDIEVEHVQTLRVHRTKAQNDSHGLSKVINEIQRRRRIF